MQTILKLEESNACLTQSKRFADDDLQKTVSSFKETQDENANLKRLLGEGFI